MKSLVASKYDNNNSAQGRASKQQTMLWLQAIYEHAGAGNTNLRAKHANLEAMQN